MPRAYAMTYVPRDATWKKMFKGQTYFVSCLALGCEQTKEASWRAANAWWYAKKSEVNPAQAKPLGSLERTVGMVNQFAGKVVHPENVPQVYNEMVEVALNADAKTQSVFFFELLGKERYEQLLDAQELGKHADNMVSKALAGEPVLNDTIGTQVKNWLDLLQVKVGNNKFSASSFDSYRREISHFESFLGKFAPLTVINESAIEGYFVHLSKNDQKQAGKKLRFDVC